MHELGEGKDGRCERQGRTIRAVLLIAVALKAFFLFCLLLLVIILNPQVLFLYFTILISHFLFQVTLMHDWRFKSLPPYAFAPNQRAHAISFHKSHVKEVHAFLQTQENSFLAENDAAASSSSSFYQLNNQTGQKVRRSNIQSFIKENGSLWCLSRCFDFARPSSMSSFLRYHTLS
jgi:type IV secretory pathway VirB3-like protein